jgi:hypothetical protein
MHRASECTWYWCRGIQRGYRLLSSVHRRAREELTVRLLILALGLLLVPAAVAARDRFNADWGLNCGHGLQCWLEIRPANRIGAYLVRYIAADRMNVSSTRCEVKGSVRRLPGGALTGRISGGGPITIQYGEPGQILVSIADNALCGAPLKVNGIYSAIGD